MRDNKKRLLRATAFAAALLLFLSWPLSGFALEVPRGADSVSIPVRIEAGGGLAAGAEIGFTYTRNGFAFLRFVPALPGAHQVGTEKDGVMWLGFFSDKNEFAPEEAGQLYFGDLVFSYTGNAENTVSIVDAAVYRVDESGGVESHACAGKPSVTITRASAGGGTQSPGGSAADPGLVIEEELPPLAADKITFSDLTQAEWAREAVEYMANHKGILGMGGGLFVPNGEVTRAQFARFTAQALDFEAGEKAVSFSDVAEDAWYYQDVMVLASHEIILGYGDGRFGPDDKISREQMAAIVDRALGVRGIALPETRTFDPPDIGSAAAYARPSIARLYRAEVINGMGSGLFAPKATATRAQSCVILHNTLRAAGLL
ncbi:MAG: S-layer homology domain-containing protein [Oscillospiraceae bacterium]|jgi:hypothetical protein|nr:S-layer homology domain-containing protein [Oscillospiraceae bacterium]